jgi:hypothetical protein
MNKMPTFKIKIMIETVQSRDVNKLLSVFPKLYRTCGVDKTRSCEKNIQ